MKVFHLLTLTSNLEVFLILASFTSSAWTKRHFHGLQQYIAAYGQKRAPGPTIAFKQSRLCTETNHRGYVYRYHRPTRRCYVVGRQEPCGELMEFTMIDRNYGTCDCAQSQRCGRPLIYWSEKKRCYRVNEQGPCTVGKWLTFGISHTPICRRNPCESHMRRSPSHGSYFWFERGGKCYKTGTQGYCNGNQTLLNQWRDYKPSCQDQDATVSCPKTLAFKTDCLPGMKQDRSEACVKIRLMTQNKEPSLERLPNIYPLRLE